MTRRTLPVPKTNYIDLKYGKFDQTSPRDLKFAFAAFAQSKLDHLCVFFHGGLVGRGSAMDQAALLAPGYLDAGAYPFFFIWNSDLLTTLLGPSARYSESVVFRRVVEHHMGFMAARMAAATAFADAPSSLLAATARLPLEPFPLPLSDLAAFGRVADWAWAQRRPSFGPGAAQIAVTPVEARDLETTVTSDPSIAALGGMLDETTQFTAAQGQAFLGRIVERFNTGHDHGLYTTIVEELLHVVKMDDLCAKEWDKMKGFIDASFQPAATTWGGTAFLDGLARTMTRGMRLTLVSHSAGAIYIDRMLTEIDRLGLPVEPKVVLIAAGVSFETVAPTIGLFKKPFRFFALDDIREGGYWEIPPIYDKSLLYFVSALCERDPYMDKPLVGMNRYWSGVDPYCTGEILDVTGVIDPGSRVWSPTDPGAPPGFRAHAYKHGGFAEESDTNSSVQQFLS